ncbi:MAG: polysaccharide biosynthesis/export family protein [Deltaproteobacteria bacterium]
MIKIPKQAILILAFTVLGILPANAQDNGVKEKAREYYLRGNVYYQQGKYKEAEEQFQKAMNLLTEKEKPQAKVEAAPVAEVTPSLEYTIGEEDTLQISVWQNPDLNQEVVVRPDGKISFPLIGDVQATGLTISELDRQMTEQLKEYIKYPEVSISIKKLGGKKVIVLGEVANPGVYSVTGMRNILEAIGRAGGFTKDAVASSVILIRGGFTNPQANRINLAKALTGDMRQTAQLQSEDIIFVPKKFIANVNYFLNQILDPLSKGVYTATQLNVY